jgi:hypothetical protein
MDALVSGKTDSELLEIVVYALISNENALLDRLVNKPTYTTNLPDAAIIDAVCRAVRSRVATSDHNETFPIMVDLAEDTQS